MEILLILVGILLFIAALVYLINMYKKKTSTPDTIVEAKVLTKNSVLRMETKTVSGIAPGAKSTIPSSTIYYYVKFMANCTKRIEFKVSEREYNRLEKGMSGTLVYNGNRFVKFNSL